jgi:exo-beta-1,3-glucanase (GH17 family)
VSVHPYGGTGDRTQSAQGHRDKVVNAYNKFGVKVAITELGWPTGPGPTSDSLNWSYAEQSANIDSICRWVKANPQMVEIFTYYNIADQTGNNWQYGVLTNVGSPKPALTTLGAHATR